jgi:LysM repeat protein
MKPTLLFAMLSLVFAVPQATAATELETLRARCIEQERQIHRLEMQLAKQNPAPAKAPVSLNSGKSTLISNIPDKTAAAPAPAKTTPADGTSYKVRPGDSLEKIARKAGCSPAELAKANGIKVSTIIHPGKTLKLPGAAIARTEAPQTTPLTAVAKAPATAAPTASHKVQQGETYSSISRKTKIPVETLIAANPNIKATALRPGQIIRLSPATVEPASVAKTTAPITQPAALATVATTPVKQAPAPVPAPAVSKPAEKPAIASQTAAAPVEAKSPAAEETKSTPNNPEKKIRSVMIEGEMTYGEFAATHGTDTNRLNDLNGLDLTQTTVLAKGSELYVPAQP